MNKSGTWLAAGAIELANDGAAARGERARSAVQAVAAAISARAAIKRVIFIFSPKRRQPHL
jgi:hypothetical protein